MNEQWCSIFIKGVFGMDQILQLLSTYSISDTTTLKGIFPGIIKRVFKGTTTPTDFRIKDSDTGVWFFELEENPEKINQLAKTNSITVSMTGNKINVLKHPHIPEAVGQANEEVYAYYQHIINQIRIKLLSFSYASNIYCGFEIDTEIGKTNTRTLRKLCEGLVADLYTVQPTMTTRINPFFLDTRVFDALYELNKTIKRLPMGYYEIGEWLKLVAEYKALLDGLTALGSGLVNAHRSLFKIGREICVTVRLIRDFYKHMVEREKELRGYNEQVTT